MEQAAGGAGGRNQRGDEGVSGSVLGEHGVLKRGKGTGGVVLPEEVRAWRGEFGDDVAKGILRLVQAAMGDWEYLRGFALRVGGLWFRSTGSGSACWSANLLGKVHPIRNFRILVYRASCSKAGGVEIFVACMQIRLR